MAKPPFDDCSFQECDLPGQCVGEGKCHHPDPLSKLRARIAALEKDNGDLILDNARYIDDNTKLLNEADALRGRIADLEAEKEGLAGIITSWKREEDAWIERNAKLEAEKNSIGWTGCGECDTSFNCNEGAACCLRLSQDKKKPTVEYRILYALCEDQEKRIKELTAEKEQAARSAIEPSAQDALRLVEKMIEDLYGEEGNTDPETGARELPRRYQDRAEIYEDIAEAIRKLAAPLAPPEVVPQHLKMHPELVEIVDRLTQTNFSTWSAKEVRAILGFANLHASYTRSIDMNSVRKDG